ncbi:hypothetical protein [Streptomyces spinosirectus]
MPPLITEHHEVDESQDVYFRIGDRDLNTKATSMPHNGTHQLAATKPIHSPQSPVGLSIRHTPFLSMYEVAALLLGNLLREIVIDEENEFMIFPVEDQTMQSNHRYLNR